MGQENLPVERNGIAIVADERREAVKFVDERFGVGETVQKLQGLMTEVTKEKITPDTVNAACNCVQNLNLTIKTAINAARFLSGK